jgi:hypothetical protein
MQKKVRFRLSASCHFGCVNLSAKETIEADNTKPWSNKREGRAPFFTANALIPVGARHAAKGECPAQCFQPPVRIEAPARPKPLRRGAGPAHPRFFLASDKA